MMITIHAKFTSDACLAMSSHGNVTLFHYGSGRRVEYESRQEFVRIVCEVSGWTKYQVYRLLFFTFILNRSESPTIREIVKRLCLYSVMGA